MSTQREAFERFDRKGQFPYKEPLDPDELFFEESEYVNIKKLYIPEHPITRQGLKAFLLKIKPLLREIQLLKSEDKHLLSEYLHNVDHLLKKGDLPQNIYHLFDKMMKDYDAVHKHYTSKHHSEMLFALQKILSQL